MICVGCQVILESLCNSPDYVLKWHQLISGIEPSHILVGGKTSPQYPIPVPQIHRAYICFWDFLEGIFPGFTKKKLWLMAWDSQNRLLLINWSTKGGLVCLQEDNEKLLTLCDIAIFGSGPFLSTLALSHLNTTTCVSQLLLLSSCWQEAVGAIFITHFHTLSIVT